VGARERVSSDAELVARCLQGDAAATRELVEQFERPVFALCLRMLRHRHDAEDAAQESLVRVVRHLGGWDGSRELLPWVLAIAANRCRTALERRTKRPIPAESLPEPVAPPPPAAGGLGEEVQQALGQLREEHRDCFVLFYEQELSILEISAIMQVPDGTIKTWLHRARKQLAELLRNRGYRE
jgi:RNA polymerase sigma-70 factor (ECF subfamily)